ncbi:hypothetical protein SNOG_20037 [Parastagonospora nodorum SN15]|uniref:Uncharacterized protein n=1 Tax=Phaeosphaeria nodorum (strain SN15 / ATCC MYA-4574 / FGSC 10173) TaxID=321614 RepID=A9JX35_PHANO|nr:hypothetical protein SNOG_20037 [Parastagonospora nodorum SN15]EDP89893.1 hypothetical protein SNOG_20037 [Parastagonospora nodorum SN15]
MIYLLNHVARKHVFVINRALDVIDSRIRHAAALENLKPFLCRARLEFCFNHCVKDFAMLDAQSIRDETLVCDPFWLAEFATEYAVEFVVAAAHGNVGIFGFVGAIWHHSCFNDISVIFAYPNNKCQLTTCYLTITQARVDPLAKSSISS